MGPLELTCQSFINPGSTLKLFGKNNFLIVYASTVTSTDFGQPWSFCTCAIRAQLLKALVTLPIANLRTQSCVTFVSFVGMRLCPCSIGFRNFKGPRRYR